MTPMARVGGALPVLVAMVLRALPAAADGAVELRVVDRLGRSAPVVAVLYGPDGNEVARSAAPGEAVHAPPGHWIVLPLGERTLARQVDVADGGTQTTTIAVPDALWLALRSADNTPLVPMLFRHKPAAELARLLPKLRFVDDRDGPSALARPEAAPTPRAEALRIARLELAKTEYNPARIWALRILDAIGEEEDANSATPGALTHIEERLGLLATGRTLARAQADDPGAPYFAAQLHQAGIGVADPILIAGTADAKNASLLRSLLDLPPDAVAPAMVAEATHYAERHKSLKPDQHNPYETGALPAILFLLAHGPDQTLALLLDNFDVYSDDAAVLAVAAAEPQQFADLMIAAAGVPSAKTDQELQRSALSADASLASLCGAAGAASEAVARRLWTDLAGKLGAAAEGLIAKLNSGESVAFRQTYAAMLKGQFLASASHCTTSRWLVSQYLARDSGSWGGWIRWLDWIPRYWQEAEIATNLVANAAKIAPGSPLSDQLDLIPEDRLEGLLAAKGEAAQVYPLDLYRAYHKVASHANGAFPPYPVRVASATERRPVVIGRTLQQQPGEYDGVIAARLELTPQLIDGRLRLHLRFADMVTIERPNMCFFGQCTVTDTFSLTGGQRYFNDRGRKLIDGVRLWRNDRTLALAAHDMDVEGAFVYEAEVGDAGLDGLLVQVDLAYFDDRRELVFALYEGDYAASVRRAQGVAAKSPRGAAFARAAGESGKIGAAAAAFRDALAVAPRDAALWRETAALESGIEDFAAAAAILAEGLTANPDNADLLLEEANALFLAEKYADAAAAFARIAAQAPGEPTYRFWRALALYLAGALAPADQALAALPPATEPRLTAMLRLLIAEAGPEEGKAAARQRYAAFADGEKGKDDEALAGLLIGRSDPAALLTPALYRPTATPDQQCTAELWAGERFAITGNSAEAKTQLTAATANCTRAQLEYHLAKAALARTSQ